MFATVGALSFAQAVRAINTLPTSDPNVKYRSFICEALKYVPPPFFSWQNVHTFDRGEERVRIIW